MATKCAINGRQWGAYDGRRHLNMVVARSVPVPGCGDAIGPVRFSTATRGSGGILS